MAAASRVIARISYNIAYYSRKEHSNLCYLRVRAHIDVLVRTVAKHHSSGNSTGVHHGIRNRDSRESSARIPSSFGWAQISGSIVVLITGVP